MFGAKEHHALFLFLVNAQFLRTYRVPGTILKLRGKTCPNVACILLGEDKQ